MSHLQKAQRLAAGLPYRRGRQRIAAVACDKKGRVLAERTNDYQKTHPIQAKWAEKVGLGAKQSLHAEIAAIIAGQKNGLIHTLYIARVNKSGKHLPAKPCIVCEAAIKEAGITELVFFDNSV